MALAHILIMFARGGKLPWDMEPLPEFDCDEKDPLIYKKTIEYEKNQREWDEQYLKKKVAIPNFFLVIGLNKAISDYIKYCGSIKF